MLALPQSPAKSLGGSARLVKLAVFALFLSLYLITMRNNYASSDSLFMLRVCQSLAEDGDVNLLNQTLAEEREVIWMTSQYPIMPSLVGVPFYLAAKWGAGLVGRSLSTLDLFAAATVSAPVISALTCLVLFQFTLTLGYSPRAAFLATLCLGSATTFWPTASYLLTEPITALAILSAVYTAYRFKSEGRYVWLLFSGLASGMAVSAREPSLLLVVPPVLLYGLATGWEKAPFTAPGLKWLAELSRRVALFLLGLTPFLLLNLWYAFARYGVPYNAEYIGYGNKAFAIFQSPLWVGLYGFLFSPGSGLILYCPVLLFSLLSLRSFYGRYRAESLLVLTIALAHLLLYAKWLDWCSDGTLGPRYLIPTLPLLVLPMAPFLEALPGRPFHTKLLALFVFGLSVVIQTMSYWGVFSLAWMTKYFNTVPPEATDECFYMFHPEVFPLCWEVNTVQTFLDQFYFVPKMATSLRGPVLLILLGTLSSTGWYLLKHLCLLPSRAALRSGIASIVLRVQTRWAAFRVYKTVLLQAVLALALLSLTGVAAVRYVWSPLSRFNSRPFGIIESPTYMPFLHWIPTLTGRFDVGGWALDRSGIAAVAVYIDQAKVADAQYGEPSPDLQNPFSYIPQSAQARYIARGIDGALFPDGLHVVRVQVQNQRGVWTDLAVQAVRLLNAPYDFWQHLADVQKSDEGAMVDSPPDVNEATPRVLWQRADSTLTFEHIPVREGGSLKFGWLLAPENRILATNLGLTLEVLVGSTPIFSQTLDPVADPTSFRGQEARIDLSAYQNQQIALTLSVKTQSPEANGALPIGWRDLEILYPEAAESPK